MLRVLNQFIFLIKEFFVLISLILAWAAVLFVVLTALKYVARISKSGKWNRIFHKIHIPAGIALVILGLLHGLLAGNFADTQLADVRIGEIFFSLNWGTACFIVSVLLGISYLLRKSWKKNWMKIHRILTIFLLVLVVIHIVDVGIQLPGRIFSSGTDSVNSGEQIKDTVNDSVTFSGAQLKDGVYEGSAEGYNGQIKVSVTVENGAVADIEILEENETPGYLERAIVDGELEKSETELPEKGRHGHGGHKKNRGVL